MDRLASARRRQSRARLVREAQRGLLAGDLSAEFRTQPPASTPAEAGKLPVGRDEPLRCLRARPLKLLPSLDKQTRSRVAGLVHGERLNGRTRESAGGPLRRAGRVGLAGVRLSLHRAGGDVEPRFDSCAEQVT